jgi:hypothetical protein
MSRLLASLPTSHANAEYAAGHEDAPPHAVSEALFLGATHATGSRSRGRRQPHPPPSSIGGAHALPEIRHLFYDNFSLFGKILCDKRLYSAPDIVNP